MIKIALAGISGRMGKAIFDMLASAPHIRCVCGLKKPGTHDSSFFYGDHPLVTAESCDFSQVDVVIDFTTPEATCDLLRYTSTHGTAHVIGTTGLDRRQTQMIDQASLKIPIVKSGNMSVGINLLSLLVSQASKALGESFDIEILEMHHRHKTDSPSGTALMLGQAAARARGVTLETHGVYERYGNSGPRAPGSIGFASLRGGSVVGDHQVIFSGPSEQITLNHHAQSRDIFARGALKAAEWIFQKPAGLYGMADVLTSPPASGGPL